MIEIGNALKKMLMIINIDERIMRTHEEIIQKVMTFDNSRKYQHSVFLQSRHELLRDLGRERGILKSQLTKAIHKIKKQEAWKKA